MTDDTQAFVSGLANVVAAETKLSHVDGEKGELIIAGYPLAELAPNASYEQVVYLLWNGKLPSADELSAFREQLVRFRRLPAATLNLLYEIVSKKVAVMDALRMAAGTLNLASSNEADYPYILVAAFPTIVASYWRLMNGEELVEPRNDLDHAAHFLYLLDGEVPSKARARALETYLNTVVDHGLNASTFTARVIISTQSDLVSAIVGAVGALKGPLHGGAPGPALDMVFEIGEESKAEDYLRKKLEAGERLMGFGHRVYKVRDPRADVLGAAAKKLYEADGDMKLYRLAQAVERTAIKLLEEYKPGRRLQTNVEFYTALLLHGIGFPTDLFTPTFALSRVGGWIAHCKEQLATGRLIRPKSIYIGEQGKTWRG